MAESGESGSFDVLELAAATDGSLSSRELERWLLDEGIARPNGAVGRPELTEHGADLAAAVADLPY